tara:strand:- start:141 stop:329 length:189 start_codon:yes stop_codon:yes gene_type:complete
LEGQVLADAKEDAQIQAQNYLNSLVDLLETDPDKVAAQSSLDATIIDKILLTQLKATKMNFR